MHIGGDDGSVGKELGPIWRRRGPINDDRWTLRGTAWARGVCGSATV